MTVAAALEHGRDAFAARAWDEAYAQLTEADRERPLTPVDLEHAATAAYLTGRDHESDEYWARAYRAWLEAGDPLRAVRCGFWLSFLALVRGDAAHSTGWLARARRLLDETGIEDEAGTECVEEGYLTFVVGMPQMASGDNEAAYSTFSRAADIAARCGDPDLLAMARLGVSETLLQMGRSSEGLQLFDEVMVSVTTDEISPIPAGITYCAVILACRRAMDLQRATEWTTALSSWCTSQSGLVPFQGQCLVHRSEILQLHGSWGEAAAEAQRACDRFAGPATLGMAFYQRGELHRLRGEFERAEECYRKAAARGHDPQPGLALLRLTQGRAEPAAASIGRAVGAPDAHGPAGGAARSILLAAFVEIKLATQDIESARAGAEQLTHFANEVGVPLLHAMSAQALGAVALAEHRYDAALEHLDRACDLWQRLEAPYETARVRVSMGAACRALGDHDTGQMHLDSARTVFRDLDAVPDLEQLERLVLRTAPGATGLLTPRETEVLRLVAQGKTNRGIAGDLFLSERTVARHVSNILTKLGVASRSAATAYAYEQRLT